MAEELYCNDPGTVLASAITSTGATTISIASSTGYPGSGNFRILIDSELMLVTGVSGTTWTVTRGIESTTATTHLSGATVNQILTAGAIDAIRTNINSFGTYASLPSTGKNGDTYRCTDAPYVMVYSSGAWQAFYNDTPATPPAQQTWVADTITPTIMDYSHGYGYMLVNNSGISNSSLIMQYTAAPSTPYTITARFSFDSGGVLQQMYNGTNSTATLVGIVIGFRDTTGKYSAIYLDNYNNNGALIIGRWSSYSGSGAGSSVYTFTGANTTSNFFNGSPDKIYYRLGNSGSNISYSISYDGQHFIPLYSEAITTYLADANHVAWGSIYYNGVGTVILWDWTL